MKVLTVAAVLFIAAVVCAVFVKAREYVDELLTDDPDDLD